MPETLLKPIPAAEATEAKGFASLDWQPDPNGSDTRFSPETGIRTNFPPEAFQIDEKGRVYVPATALDLLQAGTTYRLQDASGQGTFTVYESEKGGKYVTARSQRSDAATAKDATIPVRLMPASFGSFYLSEGFSNQLSTESPRDTGVIKLLEGIGYDFDFLDDPNADKHMRIPTPQTLRRIIDEHNLPIVISAADNGDGLIPPQPYLHDMGKGNYVVGVADIGVYVHDVRSNDHLPGVILAGQEGMAPLAVLARAAERQGNTGILDYLDSATNALTRIALRFADHRLALNADIDAKEAAFGDLSEVVFGYEKQRRTLGVTEAISAEAFLAILKNRFRTMHELYNFGTEFADFLDYVEDKQVDTSLLDFAFQREEHAEAIM